MSQETMRRAMSFIGPLQILIIILVLITAFIHLDRAMSMGGGGAGRPGGARPAGVSGAPPAGAAGRTGGGGGSFILTYSPVPLGTLFMLNFIGYIVLGVALYLPPLRSFQRIIRWLLIAFTAVTIFAWFQIAGAHPNNTGYIDKVVEVALIILLVIEDWQATHHKVSSLSRG